MKNKVIVVLLCLSLGVNIYIAGKWYLIDRGYEPTPKEEVIMSEMIAKTIASDDYQELAKKEKIIAIDRGIDKNKGGVFPYNMEVSVQTDKQAYYFMCEDDQCSAMTEAGTSYTMYQDEKPILPLK